LKQNKLIKLEFFTNPYFLKFKTNYSATSTLFTHLTTIAVLNILHPVSGIFPPTPFVGKILTI